MHSAPYDKVMGELGWLIFVAFGSFISFVIYFIKVLTQLDPGRAVPERVDTAFDVFNAGVLILDESQRIVMANSSASTIAGRSTSSLTGLTLEEALPFEVGHGWQAPWATTLHSGLVATDQQLRVLGRDGRINGVFSQLYARW